jgi:peptide/nickel transport system ATP-binding protein
VLIVRGLSVTFTMYEVGLARKTLRVIDDLGLEVAVGQVVAVVGSSGSGKSLLAHALLGILPENASVTGTIEYKGEPLTSARIARLRGREIVLIPQSVGFLDPLMRVGEQVRRAARLTGLPVEKSAAAQQGAFTRYGLAAAVGRLFPFQVSGGMARRVLMATATVGQPELLVADEPTPGLHPAVVTETLRHLRELADLGKGVILITHDLEAALTVADRVAVFYAGATVEVANRADFTRDGSALRHPYTRALWQALPQHKFRPVAGAQPIPDTLPDGCLFAPRCPLVVDACRTARPAEQHLRGGTVRCIRADELLMTQASPWERGHPGRPGADTAHIAPLPGED